MREVLKSHVLVKASLERFINYNKRDQQIFFHLKVILAKNKSNIRFQYLVYFIIHTCNIDNNRHCCQYLNFMIYFSM